MIDFSIVIITFNEEKLIEKCIDAASKVSNDIVVIDSHSTDKTSEIVKSKGARIFLKKWRGYSFAKNFGTEQCKNDWIISIDADEILSDELIVTINNLVPKTNTIYQINILGNFLGKWVKHSGWYPSWKKRIYNKNERRWDNAKVHEALTSKGGINLKKIKGNVLHYSYISINDIEEKTIRYAKLLAREMIKNKNTPSLLKQILGPQYKFINTFIFKLGFLDGKTGYLISKMNSDVVRKKIHYFKVFTKKTQ